MRAEIRNFRWSVRLLRQLDFAPAALGGLAKRTPLPPGQALHPVCGDLCEDRVDPRLLGFFGLRLLPQPSYGPAAQPLVFPARAAFNIVRVPHRGAVVRVLFLERPWTFRL